MDAAAPLKYPNIENLMRIPLDVWPFKDNSAVVQSDLLVVCNCDILTEDPAWRDTGEVLAFSGCIMLGITLNSFFVKIRKIIRLFCKNMLK